MDIISRSSELRFELFGSAHIITALVMIVINILFIMLSRKNNRISRYYKGYLCVSLIILDLGYRLWGFVGVNNYVVAFSVHISSASVIVALILLVRYNQKLFDVYFFWGLIIVPQAIITPGTVFGFPHLRFFHILLIHTNLLFVAIYLLTVEKRAITRYSLKRAIISTNIYALFVFIVNVTFGTNYMFIARKSTADSLINVLGPWPYYMISMEVLMLIAFIIAYKIYFRGDSYESIRDD